MSLTGFSVSAFALSKDNKKNVKHSFLLDFQKPDQRLKAQVKGMPTLNRRHFHLYIPVLFLKNWSFSENQEIVKRNAICRFLCYIFLNAV